jgi:hypothetical protein
MTTASLRFILIPALAIGAMHSPMQPITNEDGVLGRLPQEKARALTTATVLMCLAL